MGGARMGAAAASQNYEHEPGTGRRSRCWDGDGFGSDAGVSGDASEWRDKAARAELPNSTGRLRGYPILSQAAPASLLTTLNL